jgi:pimeloyl-ACP methyl ester carboxylesterase
MAELVDRGYQVIGYELANGKDDRASLGPYRHEHFTADLVCLLGNLKLDRVRIMGSSFGSTITLRSLMTYPERFEHAVLQGGFPRRPLLRIERGLSRIGRYWPWRMGQLPIRNTVMKKLEIHQFEGCPPEIFDFLIECSGRTPIRAAARRALMIDKLDLRPHLPTIRTPLLLIGGDRDALVPRYLEEEIVSAVPGCRRIEFQPCGHYPQYTMPAPMAAAMDEFFRSA